MNLDRIAPLFCGWDEALIWSCLQGCMGYTITDDEQNPSAAQLVNGDFCFFGGVPNITLIKQCAAPIIVPQQEGWESLIEQVLGDQVEKGLRYAIRKEADVFDQKRLTKQSLSLSQPYKLKLFDQALYEQALREDWSKDLCSQFNDVEDYLARGLGVAVLHQGSLVAGASSYAVYRGGIEIEIDTRADFREKGLATACGATLILECLGRGLYPSWDAHDLRSVALAEKLGYHLDRPYTIYTKKPPY